MTVVIETFPYVVGSLGPADQERFSQPFHLNSELKERGMQVGVGAANITATIGEDRYGLPDNFAQFLPALDIAVRHERSVREKGLQVQRVLLTARQWLVAEGQSQQGTVSGIAHWDSGCLPLGRMYTASDRNTTLYYPGIDAGCNKNPVPVSPDERCISFNPYELVHSSMLTYHASPIMDVSAMRTLFRLSYEYEAV